MPRKLIHHWKRLGKGLETSGTRLLAQGWIRIRKRRRDLKAGVLPTGWQGGSMKKTPTLFLLACAIVGVHDWRNDRCGRAAKRKAIMKYNRTMPCCRVGFNPWGFPGGQLCTTSEHWWQKRKSESSLMMDGSRKPEGKRKHCCALCTLKQCNAGRALFARQAALFLSRHLCRLIRKGRTSYHFYILYVKGHLCDLHHT